MKIFLATDHRGFKLKESLKQYLVNQNFNVEDCGAFELNPEDDYVDFANTAIAKLTGDNKAILLCGSGHGMDIVANRHTHVRAILGFNPTVAAQGRQHEDANVLILAADWISDQATAIVDAFLTTPFSNEDRHIRRINKINEL